MDIRIHEHEIPSSYSTTKHFENEHYRVSFGSGIGGTGCAIPVVIVEFKKLRFRVIGGKTFAIYVASIPDDSLPAILAYAMREQEVIDKIFCAVYESGRRQGAVEKMDQIKNVLEI